MNAPARLLGCHPFWRYRLCLPGLMQDLGDGQLQLAACWQLVRDRICLSWNGSVVGVAASEDQGWQNPGPSKAQHQPYQSCWQQQAPATEGSCQNSCPSRLPTSGLHLRGKFVRQHAQCFSPCALPAGQQLTVSWALTSGGAWQSGLPCAWQQGLGPQLGPCQQIAAGSLRRCCVGLGHPAATGKGREAPLRRVWGACEGPACWALDSMHGSQPAGY